VSRALASGCALVVAALAASSCAPVVRYTDALVDAEQGRSLGTRLPATVGGTIGFAAGIPVDVAAFVPLWIYYRSLPRETRDPLSVFLFPSFVLWKVGVLVGAPFDAIEWAVWRSWHDAPGMTPQQREEIEREWDERGAYPVYPVTPVPLPAPRGRG
jgi:hypothetical protein